MPHTHTHHHDHEAQPGDQAPDPTSFWEDFYSADEAPWTGRPNRALVDELARQPLPPGTALDLGCGTGADAIWLASEGWSVTGVDIAAAAIAQARTAAEQAGVGHRIQWRCTDLDTGFPDGHWDLVAAAYLHSPVALERERVLRRAADAVAPGGTLLVIGHQGPPSWLADPPDIDHPTPDDVLAALDLDGWTVERADRVTVEMTAPDGARGTRPDNVVRLRRGAPGTSPEESGEHAEQQDQREREDRRERGHEGQ